MIEYKLETAGLAPEGAPPVSIVGVGGAGSNVLDHIALEGIDEAELISMNCDARSLTSSMAGRKVQLGRLLTQGLGCGGDPELGLEAAESSEDEIRESLSGRRMIFVCVGLGGGTGSGAAPLITRLARETGAFVIVFATMPFVFEGKRRMQQAQMALLDIRKYANALVCFENDKMGELVLPKKGVTEAFEVADRIICQSVRAVSTVATQPGLIRIGLDDLVTALKNADSRCLFGFGQAKGEARATEALQVALRSPLLDRGQLLETARNVLVHICGGASLTLFEIETLMKELTNHVSEDAQILFGAACDNKLGDSLSVTIISSLGRMKADAPVAIEERPAAPVTEPEKPAPATRPVQAQPAPGTPVFSVQPRQASSSSELGSPAFTMTGTNLTAPSQWFTQLQTPAAPAKPAKAVLPSAEEPDLFSQPAAPAVVEKAVPAPAPVIQEKAPEPVAAPVVEVPEYVEEEIVPVVEVQPAPVAEVPAPQPVIEEEIVMEEEIVEVEEIVEIEEEEEMVAVLEEEEEVISAVQPVIYEEEIVEEEQAPMVAEEEEEEEELEVPPVVHAQERMRPAPSPMRPIAVTPPEPAEPAGPGRKFDLREILQRQRQSRLAQYSRPPVSQQPAPRPAAQPQPSRPAPSYQQPAPARQTPAPQRPAAPVERPAPAVTQRQVAPARPASSYQTDRVPNPAHLPPIRPIPAARPAARVPSPFTATKAPAPAPRPAQPQPKAGHQATFDERLTPAARGTRFEKSEPTYDDDGGDLDVPTFLRNKR